MKQSWKPGTTIYPLPAVLVSCGNTPEEYNLITVSWVGTLCTNPPMCYISVRPERYSYEILRKNMEFVINLTTVQMAKATDWCGVSSGKNYNKFEKTGFTPKTAQIVKGSLRRGISPLYRMQGKRNYQPRVPRYVHIRRSKHIGR